MRIAIGASTLRAGRINIFGRNFCTEEVAAVLASGGNRIWFDPAALICNDFAPGIGTCIDIGKIRFHRVVESHNWAKETREIPGRSTSTNSSCLGVAPQMKISRAQKEYPLQERAVYVLGIVTWYCTQSLDIPPPRPSARAGLAASAFGVWCRQKTLVTLPVSCTGARTNM